MAVYRKGSKGIVGVLTALLLLGVIGCGQPAAPSPSPSPSAPDTDAPAPSQGSQTPAAPAAPAEYALGTVMPLTGGAAFYGETTRSGFDLAAESINAAGGINGVPIRLIHEDSQLEPKTGVTAMQKLIDVHKVPLVFSAGSAVVLSQSPIAAEREVVLANIGAQSPQLRHEGPWLYSFIVTSNEEARSLAARAVDDLGFKEFAVIRVDSDYGVDSSKTFREALAERGAKIIIEEEHTTGATDMRVQLIKVKAANPPALVIFSNITEMGHIIKQARELGIEAQILGTTWASSADNFQIAGDAMNGIRGVRLAFDANRSAETKAFVSAYKEKYKTDPTVHTVIAYDSLHVVVDTIGKVGYDANKIREHLLTVRDFPGLLGSISIDQDGMVTFPMVPFKIVDGKVVDDN